VFPLVVATIDEVQVPGEDRVDQVGNFFGRMLQVVVHCDDQRSARLAKAAHQRVVLAIVAH
jgi:hypothetical protein